MTPIEALKELVRLQDMYVRAGKINPVEAGYEKEILMDIWRKESPTAWYNARAAVAQANLYVPPPHNTDTLKCVN